MDFITSFAPFLATVGMNDAYLKKIPIRQLMVFNKAVRAHGKKRLLPAVVGPSQLHGNGTFATRALKMGEVFNLTLFEYESVIFNDGAKLEECKNIYSIEEMRYCYSKTIEKYETDSLKNSNIRIVIIDDKLSSEKIGTLIVLKDIQKGEEMLRSYGTLAWIMMTTDRLENPLYARWIHESFKNLLKAASPSNRHEAEASLAATLMIHEINKR
jgi:hypothetical protein